MESSIENATGFSGCPFYTECTDFGRDVYGSLFEPGDASEFSG